LQKASVVPIEKLTPDTEYAIVLSYPKLQKVEFNRRLKELQALKVKALEFSGDKRVLNVNVLGKGCVGIVLIAHTNRTKAALKVRRSDADRSSMRHEAEMLEKANSVYVGPKLLRYTTNLLLMKFVEGRLLPKWLQESAGKKRVKKVLREVLKQCWLLDHIGLDHGELSHASKHIIVDKVDRPVIVDFESASVARAAANVTSVCHFLFMSGIEADVAEKMGEHNKKAIIESLRLYKIQRNRESFDMVLKACGL
jgi:putative serine/threonine protein kinase